jgi:hypothetical protein
MQPAALQLGVLEMSVRNVCVVGLNKSNAVDTTAIESTWFQMFPVKFEKRV